MPNNVATTHLAQASISYGRRTSQCKFLDVLGLIRSLRIRGEEKMILQQNGESGGMKLDFMHACRGFVRLPDRELKFVGGNLLFDHLARVHDVLSGCALGGVRIVLPDRFDDP